MYVYACVYVGRSNSWLADVEHSTRRRHGIFYFTAKWYASQTNSSTAMTEFRSITTEQMATEKERSRSRDSIIDFAVIYFSQSQCSFTNPFILFFPHALRWTDGPRCPGASAQRGPEHTFQNAYFSSRFCISAPPYYVYFSAAQRSDCMSQLCNLNITRPLEGSESRNWEKFQICDSRNDARGMHAFRLPIYCAVFFTRCRRKVDLRIAT